MWLIADRPSSRQKPALSSPGGALLDKRWDEARPNTNGGAARHSVHCCIGIQRRFPFLFLWQTSELHRRNQKCGSKSSLLILIRCFNSYALETDWEDTVFFFSSNGFAFS
jgi:hypothetical protein